MRYRYASFDNNRRTREQWIKADRGRTRWIRLSSSESRLKQLRPAPDDQADDRQHEYARGYKFTNRMRGRRKVDVIIRIIASIVGIEDHACGRPRRDFRVAANVGVGHVFRLPFPSSIPDYRHQNSPLPRGKTTRAPECSQKIVREAPAPLSPHSQISWDAPERQLTEMENESQLTEMGKWSVSNFHGVD
jgi:hypothetical protein